jgi:hypothetical protein
MRTGTTYILEVEREGNVSDCCSDHKMMAGTMYILEVEGLTCQIMIANTKTRAGTTYSLEVEREGNVSDHNWDYKTRAGMTYGLRQRGRATCQIAVSTKKRKQAKRTGWRWRGREGDRSDCGCNWKTRAGMTYILEVQIVVLITNEGRDNVPTGCGEGRVTCQIAIETTKRAQEQRTP